MLNILLSKMGITEALIRLRECAGRSASVLFANPRRQVFSRRGQINNTIPALEQTAAISNQAGRWLNIYFTGRIFGLNSVMFKIHKGSHPNLWKISKPAISAELGPNSLSVSGDICSLLIILQTVWVVQITWHSESVPESLKKNNFERNPQWATKKWKSIQHANNY